MEENVREIGAKIQKMMLFGRVPKKVEGIEIEASAIPSEAIGGDFFDFYQPCSHVLDLVIGDVMGEGAPAVMAGTAVKTHLLRYSTPLDYVAVKRREVAWTEAIWEPKEIVTALEKTVSEPLIAIDHHAALLYGRFDFHRRQFSFVDCGAPKPLHYRARAQDVRFLEGNNCPIGFTRDEEIEQFEISLEKGDRFLFYSDGVVKATSPQGEAFGTDRLSQRLQENKGSLVEAILADLRKHVGREGFDDDVTLIAVKVASVVAKRTHKESVVSFRADLSQLEAIRKAVGEGLTGLPPEEIDRMKLAVTEAVTNIISHGYQENTEGVIELALQAEEDGIVIELGDQGNPFNPVVTEPPDFTGETTRGFGLYIIGQLLDEVAYTAKRSESGWNRLRLKKFYQLEGEGMNISHEIKDGTVVIKLEGETLDASGAQAFKKEITTRVEELQNYNVVFDLSVLQFIDSSGLGAFLSILRYVNSHNGDLKLAAMSSPVKSMFQIVRMHKLFEVFNSVDESILSFAKT